MHLAIDIKVKITPDNVSKNASFDKKYRLFISAS